MPCSFRETLMEAERLFASLEFLDWERGFWASLMWFFSMISSNLWRDVFFSSQQLKVLSKVIGKNLRRLNPDQIPNFADTNIWNQIAFSLTVAFPNLSLQWRTGPLYWPRTWDSSKSYPFFHIPKRNVQTEIKIKVSDSHGLSWHFVIPLFSSLDTRLVIFASHFIQGSCAFDTSPVIQLDWWQLKPVLCLTASFVFFWTAFYFKSPIIFKWTK